MNKQAKYLILDTESTGLVPGKHGLIQLACASLGADLEIIHKLCTDIKPPVGTVIEPEALLVNGFTEDRISRGICYEEVATMFLDFLKNEFVEEPIVIAQFYPADYAILLELCKQTGQIGSELHKKIGNSVLDTKTLVITLNLLRQNEGEELFFPITSLSKPGGIKDVLAVSQYQAHDAMGDVLATREVLVKLLKYFKVR